MNWLSSLLLSPVAVPQVEEGDCGPACLTAVARIHGRYCSLAEVRALTRHSGRGLTLTSLRVAAEQMGFCTRPLSVQATELPGLRLPAILYWEDQHFVVLRSLSKRCALIMDPAFGEQRVTFDELASGFSGAALELWPSDDFKKVRQTSGYLSRLLGLLTGRAAVIGWLLFSALCLQLLAMVGPLASQLLVDEVLLVGQIDLLWPVLGVMVAAGLAGALLGSCRSLINARLKAELDERTAMAMLNHLFRLPVAFYLQRPLSGTLVRMESLEAMRRFVHSLVAEGALVLLSAGFCVAVLVGVSPLLALATMLAWLCRAAVATVMTPFFKATLERQVSLTARTSGVLLESLRNMLTVRCLDISRQRLDSWQSGFSLSQQEGLRQVRLAAVQSFLGETIALSESLMFLSIGAFMVIAGELTVGTFLMLLLIRQRLTESLGRFGNFWREWRLLEVHSARLDELAGKPMANPLPVSMPRRLDVSVRKVTSGYPGGPPILKNLELKFAAGGVHVITGASGAGKSLLLKLIAGVLLPDEGCIDVGGCPAHRVPKRTHLVAGLLHGESLMRGSILDNATAFDPDPDLDRTWQVLRQVGLEEDLTTMPMGLATLLGDDGSGLSAGQSQRLMLARALYRAPRLLLLDEATSHVDEATEQSLVATLRNTGATIIAAAHRPAMIEAADTRLHLQADGGYKFQTVARPS